MNLVIDANVLKGYYMETVLNVSNHLTDSTLLIFERLGGEDKVFLDSQGIIEHQWRRLVAEEWFEAWFPSLFIEGKADEIDAYHCQGLKSHLRNLGFPIHDRDFWYIRTAKSVVNSFGISIMISEDIHFYEPRARGKTSGHRIHLITRSKGQVVNLLRRFNIFVKCVSTYCSECQCT